MRLYLPKSINSEIRYWQIYREKRIMPMIREAHSADLPVFFILDLFGKNYNIPLEVTSYRLHSFKPITQPSILENLLLTQGKDFDPEKVENVMLEYAKTVNRASKGVLGLSMHTMLHREEYNTDMWGKIIGQLISTPIRREDLGGDIFWLKSIEDFYKDLKNRKYKEEMSYLRRKLYEHIYIGDMLDHLNNFAAVVYYEGANEFFAYTPDNQKLDIQFFDLKKQKELNEHKIIRFLKKVDNAIPSFKFKHEDKV